MKITKIGPLGLQLIKDFEGFKSKPYLCPANVPTIGYGSTRYANGTKVTLADKPLSEKEAEALLMATLHTYEQAVDSYCRDDINQHQFDALVSFCYNLGPQNLKTSTLLKKVNINPNDPTIILEFLKWCRAGGKILKGLTLRRQAEANLYGS